MTAVDTRAQAPAPTELRPSAPNETRGTEFSCAACGESFGTALDHRAHFKSERHVYNTKRKHAGLKAISQEAWERKLRESRAGGELKGTAHLKAKTPTQKASGVPGAFGRDSQVPSSGGSVDGLASEGTAAEAPLTPRGCLFDRKHFETPELCLAYMEKTYSFFIPDVEYCTDVPALLSYLGSKVGEHHACINCNRRFPDLQSVRRHMIDKGHTQLASEAHTRRGNIDEAGTIDLQEELEPFYDFHSSVREVSAKITDPKQKIASILRFFDADKDRKLGPEEVASLWAAASDGAKLSEAQYAGACAMCKVDPKDGLDVVALGKLYESGLADLDEHFTMLQDLLVKNRKKPLKAVEENDEEDEDEAEEIDEDGESEEGDEDEVVECEDEDEFEEVMRVLGLQQMTILDNGDLKLPNGSVAVHRDVSYIYRQRGQRMDPSDKLAIAGEKKPWKRRAQLMLSNGTAGCLKIAMSQRQEAKEGKRIIAVLRRQSIEHLRIGMTGNRHATATKIRTGRGDCSNGR